jgi:RNA polymerase sigma-70 factor, ECF subfamily
MSDTAPNVTEILAAFRSGDRDALEHLVPLVYAELRKIAARYLRGERPGHTLQPTALVNEAYVKLVDREAASWENRAHFLGCAATIMRNILVDHARARRASKRGGGRTNITLDDSVAITDERAVDVVALDEALVGLAKLNADQARVVELRYFGGLSIEETAETMGLSSATVRRHWTVARLWLRREIQRDAHT